MAIYKDRDGNQYREAARGRRPKPQPSSLADLSAEQASALRDYAAYYGDEWRDRLQRDWMRAGTEWPEGRPHGGDRYAYLHQIRNNFGPSWLARLDDAELLGGRLARTAGKKKKAEQDQRQPGQVSATLRRRMGDALADIFDDYGPEVYSETVLSLKDVILERFKEGFEALDGTVKDELGRRGVEESRQHIRAWANEIVEDVNHMGLDEVAGALEDYVGTLTAEYQQPEGDESDDLLEVEDEDLEQVDVEEVAEEDVEPEEDEEVAEGEEPEEISFEELGIEMPTEEMAASFGPTGGRRRRPARRRFRRQARRRASPTFSRMPPDYDLDEPVTIRPPAECEWCGYEVEPGMGGRGPDGERLCDECAGDRREYHDDGPSDHDDRMEERRQMGLSRF